MLGFHPKLGAIAIVPWPRFQTGCHLFMWSPLIQYGHTMWLPCWDNVGADCRSCHCSSSALSQNLSEWHCTQCLLAKLAAGFLLSLHGFSMQLAAFDCPKDPVRGLREDRRGGGIAAAGHPDFLGAHIWHALLLAASCHSQTMHIICCMLGQSWVDS